MIEKSSLGVTLKTVKPNRYADTRRGQYLRNPEEEKEFPEQPAHDSPYSTIN
jgi:hypothetical protein